MLNQNGPGVMFHYFVLYHEEQMRQCAWQLFIRIVTLFPHLIEVVALGIGKWFAPAAIYAVSTSMSSNWIAAESFRIGALVELVVPSPIFNSLGRMISQRKNTGK